jgi:hypothetical protein
MQKDDRLSFTREREREKGENKKRARREIDRWMATISKREPQLLTQELGASSLVFGNVVSASW